MRLLLIIVVLLLVSVVPVTAQGPVDAVVTSFLNNWQAFNYQAMYDQTSARSQVLIAFPAFETVYRETALALGLESLSYTIVDVETQGSSAAVTYDVTLETTIFGTIEDPGRVMRLVQESQGWRVAWSHMDIFDGMTGSSQLRSSGQREARANIYDRNGLPVAEQNGTVIELYISRESVVNEAVCLDLLAELLRRQRSDLQDFFARYNLDSRFYIGEIDDDVYEQRQAELSSNCAVTTVQRQTRNYYRGNAMSHVAGYIGQISADDLATWEAHGYNSGDLVGLNGIERAYETQLSGKPARVLQIIDSSGTVLRELARTEGESPSPVTLTIDRELQFAVAQAMADAYNYSEGNWGNRGISTGAAAVVMDVKTGAILAMTSYPLYEPNLFNPDTPCCTFIPVTEIIADMLTDTRAPMRNRTLQELYPPGSVYKIVTTAAAAEQRLFGRNDIFECGLTWDGSKYGDDVGFQRVDWRLADGLEATGPVNISQALASSCDPFFYQVGAELYNRFGAGTLADFAKRMGFGSVTGINFFGTEAAGNIPVARSVSDAINSAIGQGDVKVTVMQTVHMVAAMANGGALYKPYLVEQVGGVDFTPAVYQAEPEVIGDLGLSAETMALVREGMCLVTTDEDLGTAVSAFGDANYHACGKTGTSQTDSYPTAWFVAYAPADNPKVAVAVVVERSREGSEIAAPIVRRILDTYFNQPIISYPWWWFENEYIPVVIPEGATGG